MLRKKKSWVQVSVEELEAGEQIPAEDFDGGSDELEQIVDDSVQQTEEVSNDVSEIDNEIDTAAIDGETLANIQADFDESSEPEVIVDEETGEETVIEPEGMPPEAAAIAQEMLNNIMRRHKVSLKKASMSSLESFRGDTRLAATQISAEAIGLASTKVWEAVSNATETSNTKFKEFISSLDASLETLSTQNADIKAKIRSLSNAKPTEESIEGAASISSIFGIDNGGTAVKSIIETFRNLEEYAAKAPSVVKSSIAVVSEIENFVKTEQPIDGSNYYEQVVGLMHGIGGEINTGNSEDGSKFTSCTLTGLNKGYVDTISVSYNEQDGSVRFNSSAENPEVAGVDSLPVLSIKDIATISNEANRSINALSGFTRVAGEIDQFNQHSNNFIKAMVKDYSGFTARLKEALKFGAAGAAAGAAGGAVGGAAASYWLNKKDTKKDVKKLGFDNAKSKFKNKVGTESRFNVSVEETIDSKDFKRLPNNTQVGLPKTPNKKLPIGKAVLGGAAAGGLVGAAAGFIKGKSGSFSVAVSNVRNVVLGLNSINRVVSITAPSGLLSAVSLAQKYCVKSLDKYQG